MHTKLKKKICLKALITIHASVRDARPVPRDFFPLKQVGTTTERFDMQCSQGMNLGNSGSLAIHLTPLPSAGPKDFFLLFIKK